MGMARHITRRGVFLWHGPAFPLNGTPAFRQGAPGKSKRGHGLAHAFRANEQPTMMRAIPAHGGEEFMRLCLMTENGIAHSKSSRAESKRAAAVSRGPSAEIRRNRSGSCAASARKREATRS